MPEKKIIRIQTDNDFIDLLVNNIQYDLEIQSQLVMNSTYWDNYHDFIAQKNKKSSISFSNINQWNKKIREQNLLASMFPQVEFLAAQTIGRDIFSYNLIPQHLNALDLSSYLPYSPDIVCTQVGNDLNFNTTSISNKGLKPKPINKKEYKVLRVMDDNHKIFIDLKIRAFSEKEIITEILSLPFFWRNYHLLSRTRVVDNFHGNIDYKINNHLLQFYNPANEYIIEQNPNKKIITYDKNHPARWKQITSTKDSFNFIQLANQLMFTQPGLILPLTYRESRWSSMEKPEYTVKITNKEANLISINISEDRNNEQIHQFFMSCVENINSEDREIISKLTTNKTLGNGQYILSMEGNIIYVYEQNILDIFQMLSLHDNQNNTP